MALCPVRLLAPGLLLGVALACQQEPAARSSPRVVVLDPSSALAATPSDPIEIGPSGMDPEVVVVGSDRTPRTAPARARPTARSRVVHETVYVYESAPPVAPAPAPAPAELQPEPEPAPVEVADASPTAAPTPTAAPAPIPAPRAPDTGSSRVRDAAVGAAIGAGVGAVLGGKGGAIGGAIGGAVGGATRGTTGAVLGGVLGGSAGRGGVLGSGRGRTTCPSGRSVGPVIFDLAAR